jgi:glucosamine-6-phosphate deaminase
MELYVFANAAKATSAATGWLVDRLQRPSTRNIMVAGGNTPLVLYAEVACRELPLDHLRVFALDEYLGVPEDEPRNCANLLRRTVVDAWKIPADQYAFLSPHEATAAQSIREHEERIRTAGGLDLVILGLGQNGHIGFNEPGSEANSPGRVVPLGATSVEANRLWFGEDHAPVSGVTTGMSTILAARSVLLLAFGERKANAVAAMVERGPLRPALRLSCSDTAMSRFFSTRRRPAR